MRTGRNRICPHLPAGGRLGRHCVLWLVPRLHLLRTPVSDTMPNIALWNPGARIVDSRDLSDAALTLVTLCISFSRLLHPRLVALSNPTCHVARIWARIAL